MLNEESSKINDRNRWRLVSKPLTHIPHSKRNSKNEIKFDPRQAKKLKEQHATFLGIARQLAEKYKPIAKMQKSFIKVPDFI